MPISTKLRKRMKIPTAKALGTRATQKRVAWDVGKALQLRLVKHLTYEQVAALIGVSKRTIIQGLKPLMSLLQDPQAVTAFRENEAEILDSIRLLAVQGMGEQLSDPRRRKTMDMLRLNKLYGTLFDKQRLMRGESTAIVHQLTAIISAAHKRPDIKGKDHIEVASESPDIEDAEIVDP